MPGPLHGYRIIELGGIGPGPFAGMILADMGADVIRVDRYQPPSSTPRSNRGDVLGRGKRSVSVDLKHPDGIELILRMVEGADALFEGFRPGVAERLGVGPEDCMARNPKLVYGRMTGFGQDGPYSGMAGHDINYVALSGTLSLVGRRGGPPTPPVNFLADFGGGGMFLAYGIVCALLEAVTSGQGQVIDAAMVEGAAVLAAPFTNSRRTGTWGDRGTNMIDSGAWYYEVYETADGGYVSFGSIEPQFYELLLELTGLSADVDGRGAVPDRADKETWEPMKERLGAIIKTRTEAEWCQVFEGTDVCFAPVLDLKVAAEHPHHVHRGTFVEVDGVLQPAPAPRFSRSETKVGPPPDHAGADSDEILSSFGLSESEIAKLRESEAVA